MVIVLDVLLLFLILAIAIHAIVVKRLSDVAPAVQSQVSFWQKRSSELCGDPNQRPALMMPSDSSDPLDQLKLLAVINDFSATVWKKYESCQEPISVNIPENLLHFKVDKFNEYVGDSEPGFAKIEENVDKYIDSHTQIYIVGHTDDTGSDEHNYELSYQRALQISVFIQEHLRGKERGKDYEIYPVGMGRARLLPQDANETQVDWRTRCRRIELQFRSLSRADQPQK
jgi:outer membrane protein OmpA-like peptidoglycan-associated protein